MIGYAFAFISCILVNCSFVALRRIRLVRVNSWTITFYIMCCNLLTMPFFSFVNDYVENTYTRYTPELWIILIVLGLLTMVNLFFANLTFTYEKAGRGGAY